MRKLFGFVLIVLLGVQAVAATKFVSSREMLDKISTHKKLIWVVGYLNSTMDEHYKDVEEALGNGADAVIFEGHDYKKVDEQLSLLRARYPKAIFGINLLGPDENLHTFRETFELAKKHKMQIAWTDFSGVDLIKEAKEVSLHDIEIAKPKDVFYVSGIHMKYSTLIDSEKTIEKSAMQAMGWVDGIVITGPKTGVPTDPLRAIHARRVIGNYPMGAASGVSAENVHTIIDQVDYVIVNSSIADKNHRIIGEKVKALREAMGHEKLK